MTKFGKWFGISGLIGILLLLGVACDGGSKAKISLNATTATIDYYQTFSLEATVTDSQKPIVWTSSDETIAKVENGIVTPTKNAGRVTITATVEKVSASCAIDVVKSGNAPVLTVDQDAISLGIGDTFLITPSVSFQGEQLTETFDYQIALADGSESGIVQCEISDNQATFLALAEGEVVYELSTMVRDLPLVKRIEVRVLGDDLVFVSDTLQTIEGGFLLELGLTETEQYATSGSVEMSAYKNEEKQTDFSPVWTANQSEAFSFDNGIVTAIKEGTGTLTTEYQGTVVTIYVNVVRPIIRHTETLWMETVNAEMQLPIRLNGEVIGAGLQKENGGQKVSFSVTYENDTLTYNAMQLPKKASELGEQTLIVETDKAQYLFPVTVYTMIINNETELNSLIPTAKAMGNGTYWTGYYVLGENITCTGTYASQWNGVRTGTASTAESVGFNGIFDGQGFAIYNLHTVGVQGGLIPCLNAGGIIQNLSVINASNTGNGGLLVSHCCGRIENVYVSASVKGQENTRSQKYTSAFVSDIVSTARIHKIFVEVLEKTGDTKYCNPFYVMHEKYGIVDGMYATGTDSLWTVVENVGNSTPNQNCDAYADVVEMKNNVSLNSWENEFWSVYNGLPYPKRLDIPSVTLRLTLSATQALAGETLTVVNCSEKTLVELSENAKGLGITLTEDKIILPENVEKGTKFTVYARNVYDYSQYIEIEITVIDESDLKQGEFDDNDIWD